VHEPTSSREPGPRSREFPFLRYFLVVSILAMGLATALTTWLTLVEVRDEVVTNQARFAEALVKNIFHQLQEEFLRPLLERGGSYDHKDPEQTEALGEVVERSIFNQDVRKLYFFDRSGLIIFSTQREHIDFQIQENEHFNQALEGDVSWVLKRRNDPLDLTGDPTAEELLETYVPVYGPGSEEPIGVIEIYQGVEDLQRDLRKTRSRIVLVAVCGMGVLLLVFSYFIVRAARVIQRRRRELIESNEALQDLSRNLERLVEERTQQLLDKEKLASLGGLAAGVAHEINTPLATIAACSEGCLERLAEVERGDESSLEEIREYLKLIHTETFHCKGITRNLLDYSRQSPMSALTEVDLNDLSEQTISLLRLNKEHRDVSIETDLRADTAGLLGDAARIRQVIHNLLENAVHAVRGAADPRIVVRTRSGAEGVTFECEDNGPGIAESVREKIFDPFFTTKPPRDGTGLGLALSFSIVERHGGHLELVSAGTGTPPRTVFRFTLPRRGSLHRAVAAAEE
jgi:signal transduction histidine kinase